MENIDYNDIEHARMLVVQYNRFAYLVASASATGDHSDLVYEMAYACMRIDKEFERLVDGIAWEKKATQCDVMKALRHRIPV